MKPLTFDNQDHIHTLISLKGPRSRVPCGPQCPVLFPCEACDSIHCLVHGLFRHIAKLVLLLWKISGFVGKI